VDDEGRGGGWDDDDDDDENLKEAEAETNQL
jgi:hypothetical protein